MQSCTNTARELQFPANTQMASAIGYGSSGATSWVAKRMKPAMSVSSATFRQPPEHLSSRDRRQSLARREKQSMRLSAAIHASNANTGT